MQNEQMKQPKQQNLQSLLNQSQSSSQANQSSKGRSNSIKQQNQNIDQLEHHHHQISSNINMQQNGTFNQQQVNQEQIFQSQNYNKKINEHSNSNMSNSQIQMMMANYQNNVNSPNQSLSNLQLQQLLNQHQNAGSSKNQMIQQLHQNSHNQLQQNYLQGSQKELSQINSGNNSMSFAFPSSNQSPNNSSNQHLSLIQFNIQQNLKNQKGRAFQGQQQQQYFQIQNQQQQQLQQNTNQLLNQQKKGEKFSQSISANTTTNAGNGNSNLINLMNKGKASLILQDNSLQGVSSPPKLFSPQSISQSQQQFSNHSQNTSTQYQNFINNNFPLLQQQQEQSQSQSQNTPHLSASAATIMNMMSGATNSVMPPTNKYINDLNLQKQMQNLQNPLLSQQLQVQQNKVNSQIGSKVSKTQSITLNKKSFADKSGLIQPSYINGTPTSSSGFQGSQDKSNVQNSSNFISHVNSQSQTLNNFNLSQSNNTQSKQNQGHQHYKSSTASSTLEILKSNQNQNQQNFNQSNVIQAQVQQLASKIQNTSKAKIQQNSFANRSINSEFQQTSQNQQNDKQFQLPQSTSIQNLINPISSIENYKSTIEAYKRMVENLNKQNDQNSNNQAQLKHQANHQQKPSIPIHQNHGSENQEIQTHLKSNNHTNNFQTDSQTNLNDLQDENVETNPKINSQQGHRYSESRQSHPKNYEDISVIAAKYTNLGSALNNNIKQQPINANNSSYYNNQVITNNNNNNNTAAASSQINKSSGDITDIKVSSLRQIDQDDIKSSNPSQTNLQSSGIHSYNNTAANIYGSFNQQNQQIPNNRNSENLHLKQSLVETPSSSTTQSHLKQSKLSNLLKFQFNNQNEFTQNQVNLNGLSMGTNSGSIVGKKKKSDTIIGISQITGNTSNIRRTPSNSITQNPLLFGTSSQSSQQNIFNVNSPSHLSQQSQQSQSNQNQNESQKMSQTIPQHHHSFQLNLNKTKQLFSNASPAIESANIGSTSSQNNNPQQLQINSAKLDSNNQKNINQIYSNSFATGTLETNHFRPSSTMSASKLKHQNIITPSKSFSQISPLPLDHSRVSTMRSNYWIQNTPQLFVKAYFMDTKYYSEYIQSLNNYVDFVTNIKHPYIFDDNLQKDHKKAKSHKVSSVLIGFQIPQENDSTKNVRGVIDNINNKNFSKWKENMDQKLAQLTKNQNLNNNHNNSTNNSVQMNKLPNKIEQQQQQQQQNQQTIPNINQMKNLLQQNNISKIQKGIQLQQQNLNQQQQLQYQLAAIQDQ
ncbi:hypothetical protein TTHERM_00426210 (macronuclear) [Tetrahymena thermophila SB210]|uniref:Uncharacterized protein n=1 Tax=Tetrahymena thermophila (strain SB210) TaxID=312017 RepID=Q23AD8_TETTS|nr:hypothetical protein TTHERM_00426210 [Tetrahymena thermophila SB210]EAR93554.2 hypothetical protein TTHERM_00426210 [Tetrahymena thermophila SB210]|eukprot:XP_001013799.2 hypothetical protein TTHERM_00426210 [Tetrahymena thermophila SB210]